MNPRNQKNSFYLIGFLFILNILALIIVFDLNEPKLLRVYFFDIGQGDSILVISPHNHRILIDGGPSSKILERLEKVIPFYDRNIDLIVLTHPDTDHIKGLVEVLKTYKVDNVLWTGVWNNTLLYEEWLDLLEFKEAVITFAELGQKVKVISDPEYYLYFDVFYPFENVAGKEMSSVNDFSIVVKMVFKDISFLFTGDITSKVEKRLVEAVLPLESDILKVAHHGSKYSNSELFLENILPEVAVIQVGKDNSHGHPALEVLERLEKFSIRVLRNDIDGNIKIITNGKNYAISNF